MRKEREREEGCSGSPAHDRDDEGTLTGAALGSDSWADRRAVGAACCPATSPLPPACPPPSTPTPTACTPSPTSLPAYSQPRCSGPALGGGFLAAFASFGNEVSSDLKRTPLAMTPARFEPGTSGRGLPGGATPRLLAQAGQGLARTGSRGVGPAREEGGAGSGAAAPMTPAMLPAAAAAAALTIEGDVRGAQGEGAGEDTMAVEEDAAFPPCPPSEGPPTQPSPSPSPSSSPSPNPSPSPYPYPNPSPQAPHPACRPCLGEQLPSCEQHAAATPNPGVSQRAGWLARVHVTPADWADALASSPPPASQRDASALLLNNLQAARGAELGAAPELLPLIPQPPQPPQLPLTHTPAAGVQLPPTRVQTQPAAGIGIHEAFFSAVATTAPAPDASGPLPSRLQPWVQQAAAALAQCLPGALPTPLAAVLAGERGQAPGAGGLADGPGLVWGPGPVAGLRSGGGGPSRGVLVCGGGEGEAGEVVQQLLRLTAGAVKTVHLTLPSLVLAGGGDAQEGLLKTLAMATAAPSPPLPSCTLDPSTSSSGSSQGRLDGPQPVLLHLPDIQVWLLNTLPGTSGAALHQAVSPFILEGLEEGVGGRVEGREGEDLEMEGWSNGDDDDDNDEEDEGLVEEKEEVEEGGGRAEEEEEEKEEEEEGGVEPTVPGFELTPLWAVLQQAMLQAQAQGAPLRLLASCTAPPALLPPPLLAFFGCPASSPPPHHPARSGVWVGWWLPPHGCQGRERARHRLGQRRR
ncbi:hypothetical protein V8C86DRAFT_795525 [Haematococcus lacustris]